MHPSPALPHTDGALSLAQLLAAPPDLQPPYAAKTFGARTWSTLIRDGDVVELWDGHGLPAGLAPTPTLRALSIADHVPHDVIVGRSTAAWVHTGAPRPVRLCVLYAARGYRPRNTTGLEVSQAVVRPWEVCDVGGVRVTDPTRTALDVATWLPDAEVLAVLLPLLRLGVDVDVCVRQLDRFANWRGAGRAREVLLRAAQAIKTGSGSPQLSSR